MTKFLRQQVEIVLSNAVKYPAELLEFASNMFTISHHAYKFVRNTPKFKLPDPNAIRCACAYGMQKMALALKDHERTMTS